MGKFHGHGEAAVGTNKTGLNLFNPVATPLTRAGIAELIVGSDATPADQASDFSLGRTTAIGTEASGFTPLAIVAGAPAGEYDFGVGHSAEPTYTASAELLRFSLNQRATMRWVASPEWELILTATQNHGGGIKSTSSTGTPTTQYSMFFMA